MQANKYLFLHDAKNGVYCETRETNINSTNRTKNVINIIQNASSTSYTWDIILVIRCQDQQIIKSSN